MHDDRHDDQAPGLTRRRLIQGSFAGSAAAMLFGRVPTEASAAGGAVTVAPVYYPRSPFTPDTGLGSLSGKLAIVTGASRGNGRATAEALLTAGAAVIGTSRNPAKVPNPPTFPLVALDVADAASVGTFPARLAASPVFRGHGGVVDILANNAGRIAVGSIVPRPDTTLAFFTAQRDLAVRTIYSGHVLVTNVMLPLMSTSSYSRIIFTASSLSYATGAPTALTPTAPASTPGLSEIDTYIACKAALRIYANNLGTALSADPQRKNIKVSTVNPYFMNTAMSQHPNPIYTQPVNNVGESSNDDFFNQFVGFFRSAAINALAPSMVGATYVQLLQMTAPPANVVVGSPIDVDARNGLNQLVEGQVIHDNEVSAIPFVAA